MAAAANGIPRCIRPCDGLENAPDKLPEASFYDGFESLPRAADSKMLQTGFLRLVFAMVSEADQNQIFVVCSGFRFEVLGLSGMRACGFRPFWD